MILSALNAGQWDPTRAMPQDNRVGHHHRARRYALVDLLGQGVERGRQQADASQFRRRALHAGKAGDLDRFGHHISWATLEDKVPASQPSEHLHQGGIHGGGQGPATTTVAAGVDQAAKLEGLKPGYAIVLPIDTTDNNRKTTYGSGQLSNAWPDRLSARWQT